MIQAALPIRMAAAVTLGSMLMLSSAMAQEPPLSNSEYTDISSYLLSPGDAARDTSSVQPSAGSGNNIATVNQTGQGNETFVVQQGFSNTATQTQLGDNNVSALSMTGNFNNISTLQIGSGNSASLNITGSNNTMSQSQIGNNLSYSFSTTKSGQSFSVQQTGNK
jgi:hypothetical protein